MTASEQQGNLSPPLVLGPAGSPEEQFQLQADYLLEHVPGFKQVTAFEDDSPIVRVSNAETGEYAEFAAIMPELLLASYQFKAPLPVRLHVEGGDWVRFSCLLSGNCSSDLGIDRHEDVAFQAAGLFFLPFGTNTHIDVFPADNLVRSLTFWCSRETFAELVGSEIDGLPADVCQILHGAHPYQVFCPIRVTPTMERLILEILQSPEQVVMKRFFLQFKSYGLLYELISGLRRDTVEPTAGLSPREQASLSKAYKLLLQDYVHPLPLDKLARKVGINRTRLIEGFQEMFGLKISEFCLELRMNEAWHRLARTDEPIGLIAHSLGYEHNANFSTAVKRWFGQTPRKIRQSN